MIKIFLGLVIGLIVSIFIGLLSTSWRMANRIFGTIKSTETDDGDGPYLYLDLDKRPELMADHKFVVFKVGIKNEPPHK